MRAIPSIGVVPRHTRVHAAKIFSGVAQRKWRPKFPKSLTVYAFGPKLNAFMAVGILLYFRRKLLQFE